MKDIDWKQLEKNSESKELGFEQFCFQIAYKEYASIGRFDYYYNTPGSEFYLTLEKDSDLLNLKVGDVVGWQAKFWRGNADEDNSPLDSSHRDELIEGFDKTLLYKPNLKKWIICTPGKFSNTAPHKVVDKLEKDIKSIKNNIIIDYWHKDIFLAFAFKDFGFYGALFNHYFSDKFIGFEYIKRFSEKKLDRLKEKFDIDLYIENEIDGHIAYIIEPEKIREKLIGVLKTANNYIKSQKKYLNNDEIEFKYIDNDYFSKVKLLTEKRCQLVETIFDSLKDSFNPNFIRVLLNVHHVDFLDTVNYLNEKLKNKSYILKSKKNEVESNHEIYIHDNYFEFAQKVSGYIFHRDKVDLLSVEYFLKLSSQSEIHIFGSAGYGKTNLSCAICKKHLDKGIPALLILGSNIRDSLLPQEQIIASLDLKNEFSFADLLFALNSLGFNKKCKVPIIIDGLNESIPTAKIWKETLPDIIQDIRSFSNLMLITTSREGYVNQAFDKDSYVNVENHYKIEGFYNVKYAISKYFEKYNISVKSQFDENLFKNPLLLKIFCEANKNSPNAIVTQTGLYKSIEDYILNLVSKVANRDPLRKNKVLKGIENISKKLWIDNSRFIPYPVEYVSLIDGDIEFFENSISHAMMDEGMFFIRNFDGTDEEIQFTYDLIAGYCIAKYYLLFGKKEAEIVSFLQSDDFKRISQDEEKHPLSEDILKAIFYLVPVQCNGKCLYQISNSEINLVDYISNIEILSQDNEDKRGLINFFSNQNLNEQEIDALCEKIYVEIEERNSFSNIEILFFCYFKWSNYQRDIHWNERTRLGVWKILELLKKISKEIYFLNLTEQDLYQHLLFCTLLSSTDNALRNNATKVSVTISGRNPSLALKVLQSSIGLNDFYILERIFATLCGAVLRTADRTFTNECCEYLQDTFLPNNSTNHVVILDYIETIFEFGRYHFDYPYRVESLFKNKDEVWGNDIFFDQELARRKYFDMGFDIFDYDFVKYQITPIIREQDTQLTYEEFFSKLHFRCGLLGYTKELYQNLELKLSEEQKYRREDDMDSRENYLYKYLWTSYYEFIGYLQVNRIIKRQYNSVFRIDDIMIDPSFPLLPAKVQLVNDSFLPSYKQSIQDWVNSNINNYFENLYCTILKDEGDAEWVLLNANCTQESERDKMKQRITISVEAVIYDSIAALKLIKSDRFYLNTNGAYNVYAGELPWRENILNIEDCNFEKEPYVKVTTKPYSFKSWSNQRSNLINSFPYLHSEIALYLNLNLNPLDLSYYHLDDKVTKYIWTHGIKFYFIKKTYLQNYLSNNKLNLLHHKFIAKYGDFGGHFNNSTLNPSYKDTRVNTVFKI